ncbi:MAG: thiolase domain-containing protein [Candidatus Aenigmarchaeota archaeon]|nr:thiolase domain-containing protein [Candidatus Aenigmarchaeota archaeon]
MAERVAVIGVGLTKFGELWTKGIRDLAIEAGAKAMEDANMNSKDIDAMYVGNMSAGRFAGQEHLNALIADQTGLNIPSTRVEGACASGSLAVREGMFSILAGQHDIVLVGGAEKMSDVSTAQATTGLMGAADEEWEGFHGLTFPGLYALMAKKHMHDFGTTREQLAAPAIKNHHNAIMNPIAQFPFEITTEKVINATMVADPLTLLDCSPISDGAAAIILARESVARKYTDTPVFIGGTGLSTDALALHDRRTLTALDAAVRASKRAYEMAGVTAKDIQVAEVHDCFTIAEIMAVEDLGFFKKGEGGKATMDGETQIGGKISVNTSGGLKGAGHPVGATGIKQAAEIVMQLRGDIGKRQVSGAEIGLTHNVGGSGATAVVNIFKR